MKNTQRIILFQCFLALLISHPVRLQAQTDYTGGDLRINAPGDVPSNVVAITRIDGDLTIGGVFGGTITEFPDLTALEVVEGDPDIDGITTPTLTALTGIFPVLDSVHGALTITSNEFVETITGFAELDSVGDNLWIGAFFAGNPALTSIPTFSALTRIKGSLLIHNNASLTAVSGFEALQTIRDELFIDNAALETITGFEALDNVGSSLRIGDVFDSGNPALTSIPTFSALESVGDDLFIENNAALKTISGFEALTNIEGSFKIEDNGALTTISGFETLTRVVLRFNITENAKLTTISGFTALTSINSLTVQNNVALSSCCGLRRLAEGRIPPGGRGISGNAEGCNSEEEIIADCATVGLPSLANDIRFYPNPASQNLYIEGINQETSIIIRTLAGKTLLRTTLHQNQAIDLAFIPQGTYLLSLQNTQEQISNRLIIKP